MACLRTVVVFTNMEKNQLADGNYYLYENTEVTFFGIASVILVAIICALGLMFGKNRVLGFENSISVQASSLALAFSLLGASCVYFGELAFADKYVAVGVLDILVPVFSIASAVVFFICAVKGGFKNNKNLGAILGLFPIIYSVLRLLNDFINNNASPMASSGGYNIVALIAVLLYFLNDGKSHFKKVGAGLGYLFGFMAIYFLLVYSLPDLVLHGFGCLTFDYHAAFSVVDICIAIYIATRLCSARDKSEA